jgi:hypothetical protein
MYALCTLARGQQLKIFLRSCPYLSGSCAYMYEDSRETHA